jgi:hypothetical protein
VSALLHSAIPRGNCFRQLSLSLKIDAKSQILCDSRGRHGVVLQDFPDRDNEDVLIIAPSITEGLTPNVHKMIYLAVHLLHSPPNDHSWSVEIDFILSFLSYEFADVLVKKGPLRKLLNTVNM